MVGLTGAAPLRWGVIGTGAIASAFVNDLAETPSGSAVAVGSRTAASAERFASAHGIGRAHASYEALVEDLGIDVVYVATPHPMHHANARLALNAGKAVLVEKAFTMDATQAADLVALARARGLFLMEAMWTRFVPHIVELRRLLDRGALGRLTTVTADMGRWFAPDARSRLFDPALGGGALLDLGVYPVSFAFMVLGRPERIEALVEPAFSGVDGQTSMLLGHPGGAHALLSCTSSATTPSRAVVVGTDARVEMDGPFYAPSAFTLVARRGARTRFEPSSRGKGLWYEAEEVARCLAEGRTESPAMPLDETVAIMETMDVVLSRAGGRG